jgi:pyruvate kinase
MSKPVRRTKIVCTLGPGCDNEEKLKGIIKAGLNVARFNFSHGSHPDTLVRLERFRKCCKELGEYIPILLDTKGPEIRTGNFPSKLTLKKGQDFTFTTIECMGDETKCCVTHKNFAKDLKVGNSILVDDGLLKMTVVKTTDTEVLCKVENEGQISSHKGINLPDTKVSLPALSEKDIADLKFGCENDYDYVAASFIRKKEEIIEIRKYLTQFGKPDIKIIAKIENQEGIDNFDEILEVSDGIMVARGDLGVEIPVEKVPIAQKQMIKKTVAANKICITATQMLDSMIKNPRPTRAEVNDVANAIYDGTTCIMLSGETANGAYPVEAVEMMNKIAICIEAEIYSKMKNLNLSIDEAHKLNFDNKDERRILINYNIASSANILKAKILCVSENGLSSSILSNLRPSAPILSITSKPETAKLNSVLWGVKTILINEPDFNKRLEKGIEEFKKMGYLVEGDLCLVSGGTMKLDEKGFRQLGGIYKI